MTTLQAMAALEEVGYHFTLEGGYIRASAAEEASEASALLAIVRRDREAARAYVLERQAGAVVAEDGCTYSLLDALAIGQAVRGGQARLLGKVICRRDGVTVRWEPVGPETAETVLTRYRQRLKTTLQGCLRAMEETDYWNLGEEEYNAFCAKYGRYTQLLKGGKQNEP